MADSPDVAARSGAAARFVSCDGPLHLGGWAPDFGGPSGAAGPEAALQEFVESGPFQLPTDRFRPVAKDDGRVLFTYDVGGAAKVAVIVGDAAEGVELSPPADGWGVEVFATCDPAEYEPSTELPTDARDTGYRDGDRELWLAADDAIAYVVTTDTVEAWPATTQMVACS